MIEKLECDECGKSLLPNEVFSLDKNEEDLMLCWDCYEALTACPCGCDGDVSRCVYGEV